jgi:phage terminase large subunit GpA-like protein
VAVSTFKTETYRFLRLDRPTEEDMAEGVVFPPGSIHLPSWVDNEWLKQLTSEQLVTVRNKRGFSKLEWQKMRERNEALDCRVYARAATWIAGIDRWSDDKWRDLESQFNYTPVARARNDQDQPGSFIKGPQGESWFGRFRDGKRWNR